MTTVQVALYARVSSEQQAEANTIASQLAEVRTRIVADGFDLSTVLEFSDEGYSGSTLVRPALERLRDVAAAGGIDRLYVHCPDRFARTYAYQVLLVEEFTQRGVEVIFLNRPLGQTPEDQLLGPRPRRHCRIRTSPRFSNAVGAASDMRHKRGGSASSVMHPTAITM
jgi:site-specific DNA recombinase